MSFQRRSHTRVQQQMLGNSLMYNKEPLSNNCPFACNALIACLALSAVSLGCKLRCMPIDVPSESNSMTHHKLLSRVDFARVRLNGSCLPLVGGRHDFVWQARVLEHLVQRGVICRFAQQISSPAIPWQCRWHANEAANSLVAATRLLGFHQCQYREGMWKIQHGDWADKQQDWSF